MNAGCADIDRVNCVTMEDVPALVQLLLEL
jgi:hypothetical protein